MLKHTLVLPTDDGALATKLLLDSIHELNTILMLVLGENPELVDWADQLCSKGLRPDGSSSRYVVWIRNRSLPGLEALLSKRLKLSPTAIVGVLNFYDVLKCTLEPPAEDIDPMALEEAFLQGHSV